MRSRLPSESVSWQLFEAFAEDKTTDTVRPEEPCPRCGVPLAVHSGLEGEVPEPGNLSMCTKCLGFLRYDATLTLYALSDAELGTLPQTVQDHMRELRDLFTLTKTRSYERNTGGEA